jgi:hypothetical protein
MVHALKEAWRVTRAEVLDIRPLIGEPQVIVRDRRGRDVVCGGLSWNGGRHGSDADPEGHPEAEAALKRALAEGWFEVQSTAQFDWIDEYGSADELLESVEEDWVSRNISEDTALRLAQAMDDAGSGAAPFIRQPVGVRLLIKQEPGS